MGPALFDLLGSMADHKVAGRRSYPLAPVPEYDAVPLDASDAELIQRWLDGWQPFGHHLRRATGTVPRDQWQILLRRPRAAQDQ